MLDNQQLSDAAFPLVLTATLLLLACLALIYVVLRFTRRSDSIRVRYRWTMPEKLVYLGFVLTVTILGISAFGSVLVLQGMHGWWLLVHLGGAGAFVALLAIMSWTLSFRFMVRGTQVNDQDENRKRFPLPVKLLYWIAMLLCVPAVGSILISMFPIFGTEEILKLISLHRYSTLALFCAVTLHFLLIVLPVR